MTPRGWVFAAAVFIVPVGSFADPKVFLLIVVSLLLATLLWLGRRDGRVLPDIPWAAAWLALAILVWSGASILWSLDPARSFEKLIDLILVAGAAMLLFGAERRLSPLDSDAFGIALAAGLAIYFILLATQIATDGGLIRWLHGLEAESTDEVMSTLVRGISVAALLIWSALVYLYRAGHTRLGLVFALAALGLLWATTATSAALSASLGAVAFLALVKLPARAARWAACLAAVWALAAPLILGAATHQIDPGRMMQNQADPSIVHRLLIWRFTADKIMERPILGYGLRAARNIPGGRQKVELGGYAHPVERDILSVHPHNGPSQWWLELGLPGALLGALTVFFLFRWPAQFKDSSIRALLVGQLTTAYGIFNLSFGAWQTWWLVALVLVAFTAAVAVQGVERSASSP